MASVDYTHDLGFCPKCRQPKIQVGDMAKCITCEAPKGTSTLVNTAADPGEEAMQKLLAGKHVPLAPKVEVQKTAELTPVPTQGSLDSLGKALTLLKGAPMPKDLKQCKQLLKAIQILEGLTNG